VHTRANSTDAAHPLPRRDKLDLYEVLQVSPKAEAEVIEAAYKRLALKYHPDRNPALQANARMQELNAAYAVLGDDQQRANYDRSLLGLPPLEAFPVGENSDTAEYDWDDLPFARPKGGAVNPKRGWARLKIFLYRQRLQLLPYLLALALLVLLLFILLTQNLPADSSNVNPPPRATAAFAPVSSYKDGFEDKVKAAQIWTLDAPWHFTSRSAATGTTSLWVGDEETRQYAANLNTSATLNQPLDLTYAQNPRLSFKLNGQFDNQTNPNGQDRLFVEVAELGHDFQLVFSLSSTFSTWQATYVDLAAWRGKIVLVRFRFQSGGTAPGYTGPFIDDVAITS